MDEQQYNPQHPKEVGDKVVELIDAASDGVGLDDSDELIALVGALKSAENEFRLSKKACLLRIGEGLLARVAEMEEEELVGNA